MSRRAEPLFESRGDGSSNDLDASLSSYVTNFEDLERPLLAATAKDESIGRHTADVVVEPIQVLIATLVSDDHEIQSFQPHPSAPLEEELLGSSSYHPPPPTVDTESTDVTVPNHHHPHRNLHSVSVVAPSNLPGRYELVVRVREAEQEPILVRVVVPDDGVLEGERFHAIVIGSLDQIPPGSALAGGSHRIPIGAWRDSCVSCCSLGCCHPSLCMTCWCAPLALGQVMTRLHLTWTGRPKRSSSGHGCCSPFKSVMAVWIVYLMLSHLLSTLSAPYSVKRMLLDDDDDDDFGEHYFYPHFHNLDLVPTWVYVVWAFHSALIWSFYIFMLVVIMRTRSYIRQQYQIPETQCVGCEDFCCTIWCLPCTLSQMMRHTANYRAYRASCCCSEVGLAPQVPMPIFVPQQQQPRLENHGEDDTTSAMV